MIELHLHRELYDVAAVTEALEVYREFGVLAVVTRDSAPMHVHVTVEAAADAEIDEQELALELANYALGRTIENGDARIDRQAEGRS